MDRPLMGSDDGSSDDDTSFERYYYSSTEHNMKQIWDSAERRIIDEEQKQISSTVGKFVQKDDAALGLQRSAGFTMQLLLRLLGLTPPRTSHQMVWDTIFCVFMFVQAAGWIVTNLLNLKRSFATVQVWLEVCNVCFASLFFLLWRKGRTLLRPISSVSASRPTGTTFTSAAALCDDYWPLLSRSRKYAYLLAVVLVWWGLELWLLSINVHEACHFNASMLPRDHVPCVLLVLLCSLAGAFVAPGVVTIDMVCLSCRCLTEQARELLPFFLRRLQDAESGQDAGVVIGELEEAFDRLVDHGIALTRETTSVVVGVNVVSAVWVMTLAFEAFNITENNSGSQMTTLSNVMVVVKFVLTLLWFAYLAAKLDWDVACFHSAFRDTATAIVTSKELKRELSKRGQSRSIGTVLFFTRLTQISLAGQLPSYRVFGMSITKGLLVRLVYVIITATVALLQFNGFVAHV